MSTESQIQIFILGMVYTLFMSHDIPHFELNLVYDSSDRAKSKFRSIFYTTSNNFQFLKTATDFPIHVFGQMSEI